MRAPRWLIAAILVLIIANGLDVLETLTNAPLYAAFQLTFPVSLKAVYAGAWAIVLLILAIDLLRRRAWAFRWAAPLLTLYGVVGLIGQLVFVRADYGRGRLPFQAVLTVLVLLPVWWLAIRRGWLNADLSSRLSPSTTSEEGNQTRDSATD